MSNKCVKIELLQCLELIVINLWSPVNGLSDEVSVLLAVIDDLISKPRLLRRDFILLAERWRRVSDFRPVCPAENKITADRIVSLLTKL